MSEFLDKVTDQLNLRWAWDKVRRASVPGDTWINEIDLANFELQLESNLRGIADEIKQGTYRLSSIRPLPFPKHDDDDGNPRIRQSFNVKIRDQVAWVAVVNVIGEYVDSKMPTWSYGNRLFRSIWTEEKKDEEGNPVRRRKYGRYRHSSGQIYLPFRQGWPIFRRHIYLATRKMTGYIARQDVDEAVQEEDEIQEHLPDRFKCLFLKPDYWAFKKPKDEVKSLYWCSIDFEKFYPSLRLNAVQDNIVECLPDAWKSSAFELIGSMLQFEADLNGWSDGDLQDIGIERKPNSAAQTFEHIPTGLYVSGFLANVALLKLDQQVNDSLQARRVAHFRYVDDHIILAYSFEDLIEWVSEYETLLANSESGAKFNPDKLEPDALREFLNSNQDGNELRGKVEQRLRHAKTSCRLDPKFPTPLMTKTLALVSGIARSDFNLLESTEMATLTDQLEHLLLVDLPEEEIPSKTRQTFAATRLVKLAECQLANPEQKKKDKRKELPSDVRRIFELIQKVLRERPDRIRLWTRATVMCRVTGIEKGLDEILEDINRGGHKQSHNYLYANLMSLLSNQVQVAVKTLMSNDSALWKRNAARSFMDNCASVLEKLKKASDETLWYHRISWNQLVLSLYSARMQLRHRGHDLSLNLDLVPEEGKSVVTETLGYSAPSWAWWCARSTLADLEVRASPIVKHIGEMLNPNDESVAYWHFFPLDVPESTLKFMAAKMSAVANEGWWYEALELRASDELNDLAPERVKLVLRENNSNLLSWCEELEKSKRNGVRDPRIMEWTSLEIVRQIIELLSPDSGEEELKKAVQNTQPKRAFIHPVNFIIPKSWFNDRDNEGQLWTWHSWRNHIAQSENQIKFAPENERLDDHRFRPIEASQIQSSEINTFRGLGLTLYGLLRRSFSFPSVWNGTGHADSLALLPKLILKEMVCSSWTLGVLQSCLTSRVTETRRVNADRGGQFELFSLNDDTTKDPRLFVSFNDARDAIRICQDVLTKNQLSTYEHQARQLIPVSIKQLTSPDWNKVFSVEGVPNV